MPTPLVWRAPLLDPSGYAEDARLYLKALSHLNYPVTALPFHYEKMRVSFSKEDTDFFSKISQPHHYEKYFLMNQVSPASFIKDQNATKHLARVLFESDQIPKDWVEPLNQMDQIWVASQFNLETFSRSGVDEKKIKIIPNALDETLFKPEGPSLNIIDDDRFLFLSLCDFNPRKNLDGLLKAWVQAFTQNDPVGLVIKTYSSAGLKAEEIQAQIDGYIESLGFSLEKIAPVYLILDVLSDQQRPSLYRGVDAFVLLSHGEGWGRPLIEAMACGLPTLGINWSGSREFMNPENSLLVSGKLVPVPENALRYNNHFSGHHWFEPDLDDSVAKLKMLFHDRKEQQEKALKTSSIIRQDYGLVSVGKKMENILLSL